MAFPSTSVSIRTQLFYNIISKYNHISGQHRSARAHFIPPLSKAIYIVEKSNQVCVITEKQTIQ